MNTATIKNPIVALTGTTAKSPASTTNSATPDESFNQVLSKEMSDRSTAANTTTSQTTEKSSASQQQTESATKASSDSSEDKTDEAKQTDTSAEASHLLVLVAELGANANGATSQAASGTEASAAGISGLPAASATAADLAQTATEAKSGAENGDPLLAQVNTMETGDAKQIPGQATAVASENSGAQSASVLAASASAKSASAQTVSSEARGTKQALASAATTETANTAQARNQSVTTTTETVPATANQTLPTASQAATANLESNALTTGGTESQTPSAITLAPMHQTATVLAQTAANISEKLTPRVGTSDWNQALGQKVVWMVNSDVQSASMTLNPPDLGPLQVVLSVSNNQASASFVAAQPEVRQALEAALPRLREMLGDAGIQLGQANVSAGTQQQQQSYEGQQQMQASSARSSSNDGIPVSQTDRVITTRSARQGLVDTFA
ncbi:MAG: flagellar hook-length control protein [Burkholderiaceae bacterium]|nr:flagellar hook-length control protein [Burkholderiaceae bacterium]